MEDKLKNWLKQLKLQESTISMLLGALVIVVVGVLLYNYFKTAEEPSGEIANGESTEEYVLDIDEKVDGKFIPQGLPLSHKVSSGDHLWKISEKYYGNGYNWVDIALENKINNPEIIVTGQELTIPKVELRVSPEKVSKTTSTAVNTISSDNYTVLKGDTLWNIAVRAYQDGYQWPKIYQANREIISDSDIIEVGMELKLPR